MIDGRVEVSSATAEDARLGERWLERLSRGRPEQEGPPLVFSAVERRLKAYLAALWGTSPPVRSVPQTHNPGADSPEADGRRRVGLSGGVILVPERFRGTTPSQARRLFRAALAHAAAHFRFTPRRFDQGSLKPLQVALVSLLEDARVEQLAIRAFPGLRRLWLPFHVATPAGSATAPTLMARLARALLDPEYEDSNPWVCKGRQWFFDHAEAWSDPGISRRIGGLLGNDLGQMRVQFNARTYVVEPAYRDDNLGLWDLANTAQTPPDAPPETPMLIEAARLERVEDSDGRDDPMSDSGEPAMRARATTLDEAAGIPVATYPEWDHLIARERPDWTTLIAFAASAGPASSVDDVLGRHAALVERLERLIRAAKVSRPARLRRQPEGDQLDLDAAITAAVTLRRGVAPDPRVYGRTVRRHRDLATLVLLDTSKSTNDEVRGGATSVLALEREAVALLGHAMAGVGDSFAVRAFCSNGRGEVRYYHVKEFDMPFDTTARQRLAGLAGRLSTRLGAALRHAGHELESRRAHRRLLLVLTDGEPSDIDIADRRYLVADARRAVLSLAAKGIDVFGVGLDGQGDSYLPNIFGQTGFVQIDRVQRLPEKLPLLYLRLTA